MGWRHEDHVTSGQLVMVLRLGKPACLEKYVPWVQNGAQIIPYGISTSLIT